MLKKGTMSHLKHKFYNLKSKVNIAKGHQIISILTGFSQIRCVRPHKYSTRVVLKLQTQNSFSCMSKSEYKKKIVMNM